VASTYRPRGAEVREADSIVGSRIRSGPTPFPTSVTAVPDAAQWPQRRRGQRDRRRRGPISLRVTSRIAARTHALDRPQPLISRWGGPRSGLGHRRGDVRSLAAFTPAASSRRTCLELSAPPGRHRVAARAISTTGSGCTTERPIIPDHRAHPRDADPGARRAEHHTMPSLASCRIRLRLSAGRVPVRQRADGHHARRRLTPTGGGVVRDRLSTVGGVDHHRLTRTCTVSPDTREVTRWVRSVGGGTRARRERHLPSRRTDMEASRVGADLSAAAPAPESRLRPVVCRPRSRARSTPPRRTDPGGWHELVRVLPVPPRRAAIDQLTARLVVDQRVGERHAHRAGTDDGSRSPVFESRRPPGSLSLLGHQCYTPNGHPTPVMSGGPAGSSRRHEREDLVAGVETDSHRGG